jgi:hypothetical protein
MVAQKGTMTRVCPILLFAVTGTLLARTELVQLRTENSRTFDNGDGTYTAEIVAGPGSFGDTIRAYPHDTMYWTGTVQREYDERGNLIGIGKHNGALWCGDVWIHHYQTHWCSWMTFDLQSIPDLATVLGASVTYHQIQHPHIQTDLTHILTFPPFASAEEIYGDEPLAPRAAFPDGWVVRTLNDYARAAIEQALLANWFAADMVTYVNNDTLIIDGVGSGNLPSLMVDYRLLAKDAGVAEIVHPTHGVHIDSTIVPVAVVYNRGTEDQFVPVRMRIGNAYLDDTAIQLLSGDTATVEFEPWTPGDTGSFQVMCSTMLAGDERPGNDTAVLTIEVVPAWRYVATAYPRDSLFWSGSVHAEWIVGQVWPRVGPKLDGSIRVQHYFERLDEYSWIGWAKFDLTAVPPGSQVVGCTLFCRAELANGTSLGLDECTCDPVIADSSRVAFDRGSRIGGGVTVQGPGWVRVGLNQDGCRLLQSRNAERGWFAAKFLGSLRLQQFWGHGPYGPYLKIGYVEPTGADVAVLCDSESVRYPEVAGDTMVLPGFIMNIGDSAAADVVVTAVLDLLTPLDSVVIPEVRPGDTIPVEMRFLVPPLQGYQLRLFSIAACARDSNPYNDTATISAFVFPAGTNRAEGFEAASFPPSGWAAVNNDVGSQTWKRDSTASHTGRSCASSAVEWVAGGMRDWLISDAAVPSALTGDTVGFVCRADSGLLYEVWTMAGQHPNNRLERLYASDTAGHDWRVVWRSLDMHDGDTIYIGFRHHTNRAILGTFMLDNVWFQGAGRPGIAKEKGFLAEQSQAELVPSVAAGGFCRLCYVMPTARSCRLTFHDVAGRVVETRELALPAHRGAVSLDLKHLSAGVYVVKLEAGESATTQKVVIQR